MDKRLEIILAAKDATAKVMNTVSGRLTSLKNTVFSVQGALVSLAGGYGIGKLSGSFLDAAKTTENLKVRLQVLLGSVGEGNRLFKEMSDYAGRVPFEFEEIMRGATQLSGVMKGGVEEIKQWMPLIGDLAAASGLGIEKTTEQVIRMYSAGAASADLFRERGILAMMGFQAGVSYSAAETREKMMKEWLKAGSQFSGATDKMADTWDGMMSMASDKWFMFRNTVMDAGLYEALKMGFKTINDELDRLKETGQLDIWARDMAVGFLNTMQAMAKGVGFVHEAFMSLRHLFAEIMARLHEARVKTLTWSAQKFGGDSGEVARGKIGGGPADYMTRELYALIEAEKQAAANWRGVQDDNAVAFDNIQSKIQATIDLLGRMKTAAREARPDQGETGTGGRADIQIPSSAYVPSTYDLNYMAKGLEEAEKYRQKQLKAEEKFTADKLQAYARMYDTLKGFGYDDYAFQKAMIDKQAEEFMKLLKDEQEAEALVNEWRRAEYQKLWEERWSKEHDVMDALRVGWGLTWEEIRNDAVNAWDDIGAAVNSVTQQMGNAFADVILKTKTFKEAAHDLAESILRQTINTLVKIAMQRIILSMVQKTAVASEAAAMTAMGSAIFASMTPAAIAASIATSGGAAVAGQAAYMEALAGMTATSLETQALFKGMGATPMARGGVLTRPTFVYAGEEGPEAIVPLSMNRRSEAANVMSQIAPYFRDGSGLPSGTLSNGGSTRPTVIHLNINAVDARSFAELARDNPEAIIGPFRDELRGGNEGLRDDIRRTTR